MSAQKGKPANGHLTSTKKITLPPELIAIQRKEEMQGHTKKKNEFGKQVLICLHICLYIFMTDCVHV